MGPLGPSIRKSNNLKVAVKGKSNTGQNSVVHDDGQKSEAGYSAVSQPSVSTNRIKKKNDLLLNDEKKQMLQTLKKIRDFKAGQDGDDDNCFCHDDKEEGEADDAKDIDGLTTRDGETEDYVQMSLSEF